MRGQFAGCDLPHLPEPSAANRRLNSDLRADRRPVRPTAFALHHQPSIAVPVIFVETIWVAARSRYPGIQETIAVVVGPGTRPARRTLIGEAAARNAREGPIAIAVIQPS